MPVEASVFFIFLTFLNHPSARIIYYPPVHPLAYVVWVQLVKAFDSMKYTDFVFGALSEHTSKRVFARLSLFFLAQTHSRSLAHLSGSGVC